MRYLIDNVMQQNGKKSSIGGIFRINYQKSKSLNMYINGMCISDLKNKTYYLENCRKSNRGNKGTLYSEKQQLVIFALFIRNE